MLEHRLLRWFTYAHLPSGLPRDTSALFADLAGRLPRILPEGAELTSALRKLLEAKDCAVRAAIEAGDK